MKYTGLEKRNYRRIRHSFIFSFRIYPESRSKQTHDWDMGTIENLSAGGLFFKHYKNLQVGTILEFKITLPFLTNRTCCLGMVNRIEQKAPHQIYGTAVQFIEIENEDKDAIKKSANDYYYKKGLSD
ncbi:MAG: PilZ domain-containing protein [Candidatus Omnitrophota bacterium]|nr:PilZ domain-containing protein [Candidatus Omnitrophota bacterium]